jgi:hypothetical protein
MVFKAELRAIRVGVAMCISFLNVIMENVELRKLDVSRDSVHGLNAMKDLIQTVR